jgi:ankyrin repeat protein
VDIFSRHSAPSTEEEFGAWPRSAADPVFTISGIKYSINVKIPAHEEAQEEAIDFFGKNALNWAVAESEEGLVEQILQLPNPGLNEPENSGNTPLFNAVWKGTQLIVELLIRTRKIDVDRRGWLGLTPLGAAIMVEDSSKAAILLNEGKAAPDTFMGKIRPTALWYAASKNSREIVDLLLRDPTVDANIINDKGQTPLHVAIDEHGDNSIEVVRALLTRACLSMKDQNDQTPLSLAQDKGHIRIVEELHGR